MTETLLRHSRGRFYYWTWLMLATVGFALGVMRTHSLLLLALSLVCLFNAAHQFWNISYYEVRRKRIRTVVQLMESYDGTA